jgi:hypothetical protein
LIIKGICFTLGPVYREWLIKASFFETYSKKMLISAVQITEAARTAEKLTQTGEEFSSNPARQGGAGKSTSFRP